MRITKQQFDELIRSHPGLVPKQENKANCPLPDSKPKHNKKATLGTAVQRETKSLQRIKVVFTLFRVRPLDPDNAAGGCKDLLDGLRHSKIIPGDEAWRIEFSVIQEKVNHYNEERTIIEIEL